MLLQPCFGRCWWGCCSTMNPDVFFKSLSGLNNQAHHYQHNISNTLAWLPYYTNVLQRMFSTMSRTVSSMLAWLLQKCLDAPDDSIIFYPTEQTVLVSATSSFPSTLTCTCHIPHCKIYYLTCLCFCQHPVCVNAINPVPIYMPMLQ